VAIKKGRHRNSIYIGNKTHNEHRRNTKRNTGNEKDEQHGPLQKPGMNPGIRD